MKPVLKNTMPVRIHIQTHTKVTKYISPHDDSEKILTRIKSTSMVDLPQTYIYQTDMHNSKLILHFQFNSIQFISSTHQHFIHTSNKTNTCIEEGHKNTSQYDSMYNNNHKYSCSRREFLAPPYFNICPFPGQFHDTFQGNGYLNFTTHFRRNTSNDVRCRDMAMNNAQKKKLDVAEMRMLRWMSGVTKLDRIRNGRIWRDNKGGRNIQESAGK